MTKPKTRGGTVDRIWSVGLAATTALGIVGVVGVRTANDAQAAQDADTSVQSEQVALDLANYAAALEAQRVSLDNYRAQLEATAAQLSTAIAEFEQVQQGSAIPAGNKNSTKKANKAAQKNVVPQQAKPGAPTVLAAPPPAIVKPQATSKGS